MKPGEHMMTEAALWFLTGLMIVMAIAGYLLGKDTHEPRPTPPAQTTNPRSPSETKRVFRCTGFCPGTCCCGNSADGITASGHIIQVADRFVAAPASIPFGTLLSVPGYGTVPVLDRGGAIVEKGSIRHREGRAFVTDYDRLDLFFPTHKEALKFGVKYLEVTIYGGNEK